jgi:hypothetical protein
MPGAAHATVAGMADTPITADELTDLLGELDTDAVERLLALAPTVDEVVEALAALEDDVAYASYTHVPSSPTVVEVRRILEEVVFEQDQDDYAYEYAVPV